MRQRNIKNKEEIINSSEYIIKDFNHIFNNNNPIHLEIGIGKGKFIINNAIKNPDINYIGVEKNKSILSLAIKSINQSIPNLKLLSIDAKEIDKFFTKRIDSIYLNFSDPWPKKKHHKRRLTSEIFLSKYENIFRNNKRIIMKTDNQDLFCYSIVSLNNYGYKIIDITLDLHKNHEYQQELTEYEERFIQKGQPIYMLIAIK